MGVTTPKRDCERCQSVGTIERGICQNCMAPDPGDRRFSLVATLDHHGIDQRTFLRRVDYDMLMRAINALAPVSRLLVCLVDIAGVSRDRASEMLNLTHVQGGELLDHGRLQLRRALWDQARRNGLAKELAAAQS